MREARFIFYLGIGMHFGRRATWLLVWMAGLGSMSLIAHADEADRKVPGKVAELIQQLGNDQYAVRERAQQELSKLGFAAFDALCEAAEKSDDFEIRAQAEYLVKRIRVEWIQEGDPPQVKQILKDYEFQSEAARKEAMRQLVEEVSTETAVEWLTRLARFEQSLALSKHAALLVINQSPPPEESAWPARGKLIFKVLDPSTRPAAQWLRAYVQGHLEPEKALAAWKDLARAEERTLEEHPEQSDHQYIGQLLRQQVGLLQRLNRRDDALAVMHQLVRLERGNPQTLTELVEWLVERQAWSIVDEVATRFASNFDADPLLLYTLAQARLAQGNEALAEESAQKALKLNPDSSADHFQAAARLQQRGQMKWSDREYRHVIANAPMRSKESISARLLLSENLHDRQLDLEAAESLKDAAEAMDKSEETRRAIEQMLVQLDRDPDSIHSRMNFFRAEHELKEGDRVKQLQHLDTAIEQDPTDADVLIALYRLPKQDDARRKRTLDLIQQAAKQFRNDIEENPGDPTAYNQLAWLIANTEGNFDEAVQLSHRSIELRRAGGYLDTLGRCYFAKGDYANAVKYQTEASKLDPHSQQIIRQLGVFKKALAEQQKSASSL